MTEYGETLARYRDEAGLSQRELGAAIGLDYTQLNKIEHGHRPPLRAKYMEPLVRGLRLNRSQAEKLVDLAGLSRKVLDFMDAASNALAQESGRVQPTPAVGVGLGANVSLGAILPRSRTGQLTETSTEQHDQNIGFLAELVQMAREAQLPPERRMLAEQLIVENARLVYQVLAREPHRQRR